MAGNVDRDGEVADGEDDDINWGSSFVEQQTVSSDTVIGEDLSIVEIEIEVSTFFFLKEDERKNEWIVPRSGSLSLGCIFAITWYFFWQKSRNCLHVFASKIHKYRIKSLVKW